MALVFALSLMFPIFAAHARNGQLIDLVDVGKPSIFKQLKQKERTPGNSKTIDRHVDQVLTNMFEKCQRNIEQKRKSHVGKALEIL